MKNRILRLISFIYVFISLLLSFNVMPAFAETTTGTDPNGFVWQSEDGVTCSVTGYSGTDTNITIPGSIDGHTVTSIGSNAFKDKALTGVTIPDTITSIGGFAFYNCSSLINISIPNSITSIGDSAFAYCILLPNITLPTNLSSIGNSTFQDCKSFTGITIPNSVQSIGTYAFLECISLTDITIPDSVKSIGEGAFKDCAALTSAVMTDSVTSVGNFLFYNCQLLSNVRLSNNLTDIGSFIFYNCFSLEGVTLPGSLTVIGNSAFENCTALKNITIPNGVTKIGNRAFIMCKVLSNVTIPNTVKIIDFNAFAHCYAFTNIVIPDGVTSIGDYAFYYCTSLTEVTVPQSVTSIGFLTFNSCNSNFKIKGFLGSYAQIYAANNSIVFQDLYETYYTVTFNSQGGSAVPPITAVQNSTISKPSNPQNEGNLFAGWYKEPGCVNPWDFTNDKVTSDIILYAKWTVNQPSQLAGIVHTASPCTTPAFTVTAQNVTDPEGVKSVSFAVWSEKNGQDDLKWYNGSNDGSGNWTASMNAANHNNDTGLYYIHAFGTDNTGTTGYMGFTTITMDHRDTTAPTLSSITGSASPCTSPDFYFTAKGVTDDKSGVASVRFAVWSANGGQDDLRWYEGRKTGTNDWSFNTSALLHNNDSGVYYIHVFGTDNAGNTGYMGFTTITMDHRDTAAPTLSSITGSASPCTSPDFYFTAKGVTDVKSGVASVRFAVWSAKNGQDDLRWYEGRKTSATDWSFNTSALLHHNDTGVYYIHAFGTDNAGNTGYMGFTTITMDHRDTIAPTLSCIVGSASPCTTADFYVSAQGVTDDKSGVASVRFAVWSANGGQDDLKWYNGINDSSGNWTAHMNAANHKNDTGVYYIHIFGTDNAGNTGFMGYTSVTMDHRDTIAPTMASITGSASPCTTPDFYFTANGVTDDKSGVASVRFAVWSAAGGTDDLRWYTGRKTGTNAWSFNTSTVLHYNNTGIYYIHVYGTDNAGNTSFLGWTSLQLQ